MLTAHAVKAIETYMFSCFPQVKVSCDAHVDVTDAAQMTAGTKLQCSVF